MKPFLTSETCTAVEAHVLAWATVTALPDQLAKWRKQPTPMPRKPFSASQLKQSEDQTVAAVWAVCSAIADFDGDEPAWENWGVVAATRFCGREANAESLDRYRQEGAWGISPHSIPHHSMHAVSGTISQLFSIHGPNFGVGNGPSSVGDGWLVAATMLSENIIPGLWLVFTGYDGEFLPSGPQHSGTRAPVQAVAFALVAGNCDRAGLRIRISPEIPTGHDGTGPTSELALTSMIDALTHRDEACGLWRLPGAGYLEIEQP